jgi:hypothetical protein
MIGNGSRISPGAWHAAAAALSGLERSTTPARRRWRQDRGDYSGCPEQVFATVPTIFAVLFTAMQAGMHLGTVDQSRLYGIIALLDALFFEGAFFNNTNNR